MNRVFLLMSTNEDPIQNLQRCYRLLQVRCQVLRVSSVYETPPVGAQYQANFLDAVVELDTEHAPLDFREHVLGEVETLLGRQRPTPRTEVVSIPIDLDILLWNDAHFTFGEKPWQVPDPKILHEAHLAVPLAELAPALPHPTDGRPLAAIAAQLGMTALMLRPDVQLGAKNG
ncbi:MAG: 2-amino-4-hydroxy-6-hydroxymethyldihydropteridine diphosphokinase [Anaerolineae bacterium]|nr:2-amino-4-hydroxy-6-hydroxymethyldihydropteridine diphosphokinase [Anaerolineae bacterium]